MKKNIFIVVLALIIVGLGGYLVYDKVIDKDVDKKKNEVENKADSKIVALTGKEIDEWIDKELKIDGISFINFIDYSNNNSEEYNPLAKVGMNDDLLDNNLPFKLLLTAKLSNISYTIQKENSNCNEQEEICTSGAFAPKDDFLNAYEEIFGETLDTSNLIIKDGKIMYYTRPTGVGLPAVKFKADKIIYKNGIYMLTLNVGILNDDGNYNFDNDYIAKVKFSKSKKYYRIISFIIN